MKFSTRSTYGIRILLNLLQQDNESPVSLASIAEKEDLSLAYLERIMSTLKKNNLVLASKGVNGGYTVKPDIENLPIYNVLEILDPNEYTFPCIKKISILLIIFKN